MRLEDVVGDGADEEMVMVIVVMRIMMADRLDCTATATTTTTTAAAAVADQLQTEVFSSPNLNSSYTDWEGRR